VSNHKEEEGEDGESEDPSNDILALSGMHTGKIQAKFGPFSLPCYCSMSFEAQTQTRTLDTILTHRGGAALV
jgi:hypothetical protein